MLEWMITIVLTLFIYRLSYKAHDSYISLGQIIIFAIALLIPYLNITIAVVILIVVLVNKGYFKKDLSELVRKILFLK